jgi:hypothetical protein
MPHFRCPRVASAGTEELLAAVADVEAGWGFPVPGDLSEQTAFFADALHLVIAEKNRIEAKRATAAADVQNMIGAG